MVDFPLRRPGEPFPPPRYEEYRRQRGLVLSYLPNGNKCWLVTRHEDVREVLTNRGISSNPDHPGFPNISATMGVPRQEQIPGWFVGLDSPEHDRFRKALIPEFTVRRVREMRPAIERTVDERIDALLAAGNQADLVAEFALPVPSLVISTLLGVPRSTATSSSPAPAPWSPSAPPPTSSATPPPRSCCATSTGSSRSRRSGPATT